MNKRYKLNHTDMKELNWIESKSKIYDTTKGELNGEEATMVHMEFKGNLPYRMIQSLRKEATDNVIKLDDNGSWVTLRFSSKKGDNYSEIYINKIN